jgi:hypothetical protein
VNAQLTAPRSTAAPTTNDPRDRDEVNTPTGGLYYRHNPEKGRWEYWTYANNGHAWSQAWRPSHFGHPGWSPSTRHDVTLSWDDTWGERIEER